MEHILHIWINCPTVESAEAITEALLTQRLIAAANRYAPIQSAFVWNGAIQRAEEHPLLLKTRPDLAQAVEDRVRALHPYEVPSITRIEATANAEYVAWLTAVTRTG